MFILEMYGRQQKFGIITSTKQIHKLCRSVQQN